MSQFIKRVKSFKEWSDKKLIVIHMETLMLDVETCLKMARIPFEAISYRSEEFIEKLESLSKHSIGIVITGSRTKGEKLPELPFKIIDLGIPILGLCYGNEWLAYELGAEIIDCNPPLGEQSEVDVILYDSILFEGIESMETIATMAHFYMIKDLPPGCKKIASTDLCPIAGFENIEERMFGLQFHPEKGYLGDIIFKNFYNYCNI
jgi:GMP synthase (glutamine-hydrolysing)